MSEVKDKVPDFDVTITGKIRGFNIATREEFQELREELQRQTKEHEGLRKLVKEQQAMMNVLNSRIERLESFLRSFK
ncbi:MAG: hypothetical protein ACE5OO_08725 [Candidatus Bathyarchaeia archaeon]